MKLRIEFFIIFIISSIVIINQICLIQIFAYEQYYHFASVIISLALIGFGLSGYILKKFIHYIDAKPKNFILTILELTALSIPLSLILDKTIIKGFDSFLIFYDSNQLLKFFLTAFIYCIQFTFLAVLIGSLFYVYLHLVSRLYFFNLFGSAIGGLTVLQLLWDFSPELIYSYTSIAILCTILVYYFSTNLKITHSHLILLILSMILIGFIHFTPVELKISQFKSLYRSLNFLESKKVKELKSPYGKIEIVQSSALRTSPGLSLNSIEYIPSGDEIFINADSYGIILKNKEENELEFLKHSTLFLPYQISKNTKVLILQPSGNLEILRGLIGEAKQIYVTELNPLINEIIISSIEETQKRKITLIRSDPRNFIEITDEKFDLIFYPVIQSTGFYSGLYSLQETYFLTKEAFQKYFKKLKDGGYLSFSTNFDYPLRSSTRLINLFVNLALSQNYGKKLEVIVINNWNTITCLLKKGNFTQSELDSIISFCRENQFDILIFPDSTKMTRNFNHKIFDSFDLATIDSILSNSQNFNDEYLFKINPPDDNQPYFFNFIKLTSLKNYLERFSFQRLTYFELGYFIYLIIFVIVGLALGLIVIFTILKINLPCQFKSIIFLYFSLIGFAYMIIELSLIQKNILYLSSDTYAITFVISLLLFSTGIGSLVSSRLKISAPKILALISIISLIILFVLFLYDKLFEPDLISKTDIKYIILGLTIFVLGFFMGFPFPLGISFFGGIYSNAIPLAWAINGSFSVLGSMSAIIFHLNAGFRFVMGLSAVLYFLAGLIFYFAIVKKN